MNKRMLCGTFSQREGNCLFSVKMCVACPPHKEEGLFFCLKNEERNCLFIVSCLPFSKEEGLICPWNEEKREVCTLFKRELTMLEG